MSQPRGSLQHPYEGFPAYGAVHDVLPNQQLRDFLFDFSRHADGVFVWDTPTIDIDPNDLEAHKQYAGELVQIIQEDGTACSVRAPEYDSRRYYRVFDPESLGVSVVEIDASKRAAQTTRAIWQKNDLGAVENEARNELARRLPDTKPRLVFNRTESVGRRLPNAPKSDVKQKLALMPDTDKFSETFNLIENEADIVLEAIRSRLKQFIYPWDITPHLTYAAFRSHARTEQIVKVKEAANDYLEKYQFGIQLGALTFRHRLVRNSRH